MDYTIKHSNCNHFILNSATSQEIQNYTEKVRKGKVSCNLPPCPRCNTLSDTFKRHEARQRQFLVVVKQIVHNESGLLIRWKCPACNKSITGYPDFALPYKRYTRQTIMNYSDKYVSDDKMTYRKLVIKMPLGYSESEKQLEYSTVHRWISTLGRFNEIIRKSQELILQADPASTVCRDMANLSINRNKYQKNDRKKTLFGCRKLLFLEALYPIIFGVSIFPKFATTCGFR